MWKRLLWIAVIVFASVTIEVTLLYLQKTKGNLGFRLSLKPDFDGMD